MNTPFDAPTNNDQPNQDSAASMAPVETSEVPLAAREDVAPHNTFFFGRFGLRAGYGMLIFLVVFAILSTLGGFFALGVTGHLKEMMAAQEFAKAHPNMPRPHVHIDMVPVFTIVQDGVWFFGLLGLGWFFHKGERRPMRAYGLGAYRRSDLIPGAIWGLVMMSALVGALWVAHLLVFDGQNVHGLQILHYGVGWLVAFLLVGFAEEYTFRGYMQYTLMRGVWGLAEMVSPANARRVAFWLAAIILSGLFALVHTGNGGETSFGLLQVFLAGIAFAYALWRTGSLWWGIGFHMTWDWAQSFLFGVADSGTISVGRLFVTHPQGKPILSGGPDGPEGSVFATVALLLTMLVLRFTTRPGMHPALEPETSEGGGQAEFHNAVA